MKAVVDIVVTGQPVSVIVPVTVVTPTTQPSGVVTPSSGTVGSTRQRVVCYYTK